MHAIPPSTTLTPSSHRAPTTPSAAQQAWIQLFRALPHPRSAAERNVNPIASIAPAPEDHTGLPRVGGNYDFVEPMEWPPGVYRIPNNVFAVNRPYPVARRSSASGESCGCDGQCLGKHGSTLNSACLNVATCWICDSTNCSLGEACGNRFHPRYALDLIQTRVGLGVVCCEPIPRGAFVVEYVGEVLLADDADKRANKQYQAELRTTAYWVGGMRVIIDAISCGNESRFINHSCHPNCALYDCNWTNTSRLGIFALRDIPPLQELTFQYRQRSRMLFQCQCGWPKCKSELQPTP